MSVENMNSAVAAGSAWQSMIPMVLIFVIFYFFLIRPQLKRQRQVDQMVNNLKKGDRVVAAGGLFGVISKIEGNVIFIEISDSVRIKALKSSVTEVLSSDVQQTEAKADKLEKPVAAEKKVKAEKEENAEKPAKKTKAKK